MSRFLKEPLLHFLLAGLAIFVLYELVNDDQSETEIVLDQSDVEEIISKYTSQFNKAPSEIELLSILNDRIKQEVLYREALALNLDHNDEIIKRRMAKKMEFLSGELSSLNEASIDSLRSFHKKHQSKYMSDPSFSFYQVYFDPRIRENPEVDIERIKKTIRDDEIILRSGDPISLEQEMNEYTGPYVERQFGKQFTSALDSIPLGEWTGPIESSFGFHLVKINSRNESAPLAFEQVEEKVRLDFNLQAQKQMEQAVYAEILKKYKVELDLKEGAIKEKLSTQYGN